MRLGIMQPYFFPYLGHFSLISSVDEWIVFDVTQYTPKTWMNRNRILHPTSGWQYVTVPLSNSSNSIKTSEASVLNLADAKKSIIGKLSHYKKSAPYFRKVIAIVEQAFEESENNSLVSLNVSALNAVCDYLGLPFSYKICSRLPLEYSLILGPGDWAPHICQQLGATEYVNPIAGKNIFEKKVFHEKEVSLYLAEFTGFNYATASYCSESHLSILDVMMWNSPEDIMLGLKLGTKLIKAW
jgi:hypothetical protein